MFWSKIITNLYFNSEDNYQNEVLTLSLGQVVEM